MLVRTYLKQHPKVKEFWLQADEFSYCRCNVDNFDDMKHWGDTKIKSVEEAPEEGELITLHI